MRSLFFNSGCITTMEAMKKQRHKLFPYLFDFNVIYLPTAQKIENNLIILYL